MIAKNNSKFFLRTLLLLNVVILMLFNILPNFIGVVRFIVLGFSVLYVTFNSLEKDRVWKWQIAFLVYMLFSCLHTYFNYGFFSPVFGKLFISSLAWSIGLYLVCSQADFFRLYKVLFLCLTFSAFFLAASNILGFGTGTGYSESTSDLKFGVSDVNIVKFLAIFIVIMLPLVFDVSVRQSINSSNIKLLPVIAISLVFILLGFKRGAILSLIAAVFIFTLNYKKKSRILIVAILAFVFAVIFLNIYSDDFNQIKNLRLQRTEESISGVKDDSRLIEANITLETAFSNGPIILLFGNGMFSEQHYYNTRRMHHTDYFTILHGGGLIGMILYFGSYFVIFIELRKNHRKSYNSYINSAFYASAIGLILAMLLQGASGFLHAIDLRMYSFIFLGATLKFLKLGGENDNANKYK